MAIQFIGRQSELARLQQAYNTRGEGRLIRLYGRRRIGKSFLLQHFAQGKRSVFYQATRQAAPLELRAFTDAVREVLGGERLPEGYSFPDWEIALRFISENAGGRLLVVLDEYPYLSESTPGLESVLQRWWDQWGQGSDVMLVLSGSAQAFMAALDGHAAPLHHRFSDKIHLGPLSYREAALFTPQLSQTDHARIFGMLGGTPFYLRQWREDQTVRENVIRLFADPAGLLFDSALNVLSTDLEDASAPYRILQVVAAGATRWNDIRQQAALTSTRPLDRLLEIGLLEKRVPVTEDPDRSRQSIYRIGDPYFRFYFRFIHRSRGPITRGLGENVADEQILPFMDDYMGDIFEQIARAYCLDQVRARALRADDVGSWWSRDGQHEIDVLGVINRRPSFAASVKWRDRPLDRRVLQDLEADIRVLDDASDMPRLLIGRRGIDPAIAGTPHVTGVSIDDLYA